MAGRFFRPGGSSSGIGTNASFWTGNVDRYRWVVVVRLNSNLLVGIRPTIGRISRWGVIPITADHDTAGPMTRTVTDAALMLGAIEEDHLPDPNDDATKTCTPPANRDYTPFLKADGLKGKRIGIPRAFYYDAIALPGENQARGGINAEQQKLMADAIAVLKQQGAIIVDPADVPSFVDKDPNEASVV